MLYGLAHCVASGFVTKETCAVEPQIQPDSCRRTPSRTTTRYGRKSRAVTVTIIGWMRGETKGDEERRRFSLFEQYQSRTISASALRVAVLGILKSPP
jgi:hypothetical protein